MSAFDQFVLQQLAQTAPLTPEHEKTILTLLASAKAGHLCCSFEGTLPEALCADGAGVKSPTTPLVRHGHRLYFQKNWALETKVVEKIAAMRQSAPPPYDAMRFQEALTAESLTPAQAAAISRGIAQRLTIFSGGPGTGKTYTAAAFIRCLAASQDTCRVILTAPTGKAASHLEAVFRAPPHIPCQATTLHRLLQLRPNQQKLQSTLQIEADLVVVDEASMMDVSLFLHLLNAVGPHTRLLLLGDANQLPPVEGVSFFRELAQKLGQPLTRSIRMGDGMVGQVAEAILDGKLETIPRTSWIEKGLVEWLVARLPSPHWTEEPEPAALLQALSRFRILSALRQGPFGVDALNRALLAKFSAENPRLAIPILILENRPQQQLYNGTAGVLVRKQGSGIAYFSIEGVIRQVPEAHLPRHEVAFCLSIHKSQGSEFDEVLILLGPGSERFGKEALYTAVTRAKKKVEILADETAFRGVLQKQGTLSSGFSERM